jgi:hypothetical protein
MSFNGGNQKKSAVIADAAAKVAARLASPEAQARLAAAAEASRNRSKAIVQGAIIDPKFLAKRVTF